ncbi:MAG: hypothetical protein IJY11_02960 [Clostridia bacterium]|nr:hypothetical protein [Clostridia bacterium]
MKPKSIDKPFEKGYNDDNEEKIPWLLGKSHGCILYPITMAYQAVLATCVWEKERLWQNNLL